MLERPARCGCITVGMRMEVSDALHYLPEVERRVLRVFLKKGRQFQWCCF